VARDAEDGGAGDAGQDREIASASRRRSDRKSGAAYLSRQRNKLVVEAAHLARDLGAAVAVRAQPHAHLARVLDPKLEELPLVRELVQHALRPQLVDEKRSR
jgi:hypothetical protein